MKCEMCRHEGCEGCCDTCSDPSCPNNAGCPECSKVRPMSIAESDSKRTEATGLPIGAVTASAPPSSARTPAAVFGNQLQRLTNTIAEALNPDLVRVPESVSGTPFPCYAEAPWPYEGEQADVFAVNDAEVEDGYERTTLNPVVGRQKFATYLVRDGEGTAMVTRDIAEGDDGLDLHRAGLRKMYGRKNRHIKEWGTYPGMSTDLNAENGQDPE